jgi:hypothetical protein
MGLFNFLFGRRGGGPGSSAENAIVVDSVEDEYIWLAQHYSQFTLVQQSLSQMGDKHYDVMRIRTGSGEEKDIFFDVTSFFGK